MRGVDQLVEKLVPTWVRSVRTRSSAKALLAPVLAAEFPDLVSHTVVAAKDDVLVAFLTFPQPEPPVMLHVGLTELGDTMLAFEAATLDAVAAIATPAGWSGVVANVARRGSSEHGTWFTRTVLPGTAVSLLADALDEHLDAACRALKPLHTTTSRQVIADDELLDRLISHPLSAVRDWRPGYADALTAIDAECRQRLASLDLAIARQHGRFSPASVLWNEDEQRVSGIIDWVLPSRELPPEVDYVHYAVMAAAQSRRSDSPGSELSYGHVVADMLRAGSTGDGPLATALSHGPNHLDMRTALTLGWLQHTVFGVHRARKVRASPAWLERDVDPVIEALRRFPVTAGR